MVPNARGLRFVMIYVLLPIAGTLLLLAALAVPIVMGGISIVRDPLGIVSDVKFDYDNYEPSAVPLRHLPGRVFVGMPDRDGTLLVICKNGRRPGFGYVTPGMTPSFVVTTHHCDGSQTGYDPSD